MQNAIFYQFCSLPS